MQIDAIINVIAVIVLPCITFIVGKELEKRQNKEDLIMEFYRPMIEEFRSLDHLYETLSKGIFENSLGSYFNTLLEFDKNHTLLIITNIDRKLTKPMRKIIDDLIPTFDKIEEKRQQKLKELLPLMEIAYSKILEDHSDGATKKRQLDKRKFMPQVYEGLKWNLWRDDRDQAKQIFEEIVKGVNDVIPTVPPVSTVLANQLYKVFSEIYVKEMTPIREDLVKIGTSLKSTVSEEILPIMKKRMETIGK